MSGIVDEKKKLRSDFREQAHAFLAAVESTELARVHERIAGALRIFCSHHFAPAQRENAAIAVYEPMKVELPAREIVGQSGVFPDARFLLPQIDATSMWFTDSGGRVCIPDFVIVPGLYTDARGNRLGRGKGYYDRFFRQNAITVDRRLFLGYPFQFIDSVPADERDEKVTPISLGRGIQI